MQDTIRGCVFVVLVLAVAVFFVARWQICGSAWNWNGVPGNVISCFWETRPPQNQNPEISMSAYDLLVEYKRNEVRADAMYKDQFVEVSGTIHRIEGGGTFSGASASFDFYTGSLTPDSVRAFFSNEDSLVYIDPGDRVSLFCIVDGRSGDFMGTTVDLRNCTTSNDRSTP